MKVYLKQIFFISLFCLGIEIIVFPVVAQEQQEVKQTQEEDTQGKVWNPRAVSIEPSAPEPLLLNFPSTSYRKELLAAMKFHNMANTIQSMVDSNDYRDTLIDLALVKRRMADLEKCNVTLLSNNFSDPQNVWDKMKSEAERMSQEYALSDVVEMDELSKQNFFDENALTGVDSLEEKIQEEVAENLENYNNTGTSNLIDWSIGYSILKDLYENQDKWGSRISRDSFSFSLWEDQKYLYDVEVWDPKYIAINTYYGVNPNYRPKGVDKKKYDYYFYEDVQQAHQDYLISLSLRTRRPKPIGELAEPPQVPPRPLPPRSEIVLVQIDNNNVFEGVYPNYPEPWQTFIDENFRIYAKNGEMAQIFNINPYSRRISFKNETDPASHNRISRYLTTKYELNKKYEELEEQNNRVQELKEKIEEFATYNDLKIPEDINYADPEDLKKIKVILLQEKNKKIAAAKPLLKEDLEFALKQEISGSEQTTSEQFTQYDNIDELKAAIAQIKEEAISQDQNASLEEPISVDYSVLLEALEYDGDAEVAISFSNIDTIQDALKEARSNSALIKLALDEKQKVRDMEIAEQTKQIDGLCSNGGIQGTFNVDSIQIQ